MKSDLKGPEKVVPPEEYPCLKLHKPGGFAVLFTAPGKGTVVHEAHTLWGLGHAGTNWAEELFEPLKGKITLSN